MKLLLLSALLALTSCATTDDLADYHVASGKKDKAVAKATMNYVNGKTDDAEYLDEVEKAQSEPDAVVQRAEDKADELAGWGDFALAVGKTLGVPAVLTGIGGIALDRIRDRRRVRRGEPVDTDGDGVPDAEDDAPLDPNRGPVAV